MLMRCTLGLLVCAVTMSCTSGWHPYVGHVRIYEESKRTGVCALHHVPLVTVNAYAYDFAFGAAIDWTTAGMKATEKYPNVLNAVQSREKTKENHIPIKVLICPICQQKFDEYMRKHPER